MAKSNDLCQITEPSSFSALSRPRLLVKLNLLIHYLRHEGLPETLARAMRFCRRRMERARVKATPKTRSAGEYQPGEVLNLQPGEWVEVKSPEEIRQTLDQFGRNRGLAFLGDMWSYCGRRFPVYKRLERVYLEESQQRRSMKNTVLLSGVVCNGNGYGCDRSCLYYWREAWLRRAAPPANGDGLVRIERG